MEDWDPVNRFNDIRLSGCFTPIDRPKSVHNRCVIEVFVGFFDVVIFLFFYWIKCWDRGFRHRTDLDHFLFFLVYKGIKVERNSIPKITKQIKVKRDM